MATIRDLEAQVVEFRDHFPSLKKDDLFTVWFMRAYLVDDENDAVKALTGASGDEYIDALYIDNKGKLVYLLQIKYRTSIMSKVEKRQDVVGFANLASVITNNDDGHFEDYFAQTESGLRTRLHEARKLIKNDGFALRLQYVTLGRCSEAILKQAKQVVRHAERRAIFELFDGKRVLEVLQNYLEGVAPPIPEISLKIEQSNGINVEGTLRRYDTHNGIETRVFSIRGDGLTEICEHFGLRLFARNIRGFLGEGTLVNESMIKTLKCEPEKFYYYNNGITLLCDDAQIDSPDEETWLRVTNPQIINGQQTTRVLAAHDHLAKKASVLVKVIKVPRMGFEGREFDTLLSKIVAGTNWQNKISASDLMSNDRIQIDLERAFRKRGYLYVRKKGSKRDLSRNTGIRYHMIVMKTALAQAVAGCEFDPSIVRNEGKEGLFEEAYYSRIFSSKKIGYYITRYWLSDDVRSSAKGRPEWAYLKWTVLGFLWQEVSKLLATEQLKSEYARIHENKDMKPNSLLLDATRIVFRSVMRYYKKNKGRGERTIDISSFFKLKNHHKQFAKFWASSNSNRKTFDVKLNRWIKGLQDNVNV